MIRIGIAKLKHALWTLLLYYDKITTHLHMLFNIPSMRFLRMAISSSSRFWSNCSAILGSHPNNLIMRMTFIAVRGEACVSFE